MDNEIKPNPEQELDRIAFTLLSQKSHVQACEFCDELIADARAQINGMQFYNIERVDGLQNSIMTWGAIKARIQKHAEKISHNQSA